MSIAKQTEKGRLRRLDQISRLKEKRGKFKDLDCLKGSPGWNALKIILQENIKTQEFRIKFCLSQDSFDDFNHSQARTAEALLGQLESIIDAVEDPNKPLSDIDNQIHALEKEIEADDSQDIA